MNTPECQDFIIKISDFEKFVKNEIIKKSLFQKIDIIRGGGNLIYSR